MIQFINDFLPANKNGIYLVGGSVRDQIMGLTPSDLDIVTKHNVTKLSNKIAKKINGKTIQIGKEPNKIIKIVSPTISIDVVSLKNKNIEANLMERDFTINSIAYAFSKKRILDPTNGLKDIRTQKIRMVKNSSFQQDPIRLIRAYRIALFLNFKLTKETEIEIIKSKENIKTTSGERVWLEISKIFNHPNSNIVINNMVKNGLILAIFPELSKNNYATKQNIQHIYNHVLKVYKIFETMLIKHINNLSPNNNSKLKNYSLIKYTFLLHDIGKLTSMIFQPNGIITYKGHSSKMVKLATNINNRLKLSTKQKKIATSILKNTTRLSSLSNAKQKGKLTKVGIFSCFEKCQHNFVSIIEHIIADTLVKACIQKQLPNIKHLFFLYSLKNKYKDEYYNFFKKKSLITGMDLIHTLEMVPSSKFKNILNAVKKATINEEISNKQDALKIAKGYTKKYN